MFNVGHQKRSRSKYDKYDEKIYKNILDILCVEYDDWDKNSKPLGTVNPDMHIYKSISQMDSTVFDIYLEPQTTIYKWLFQLDDSKPLYRKWLFHQTSILNWLFGVPGNCFSIPSRFSSKSPKNILTFPGKYHV